MALNVYRSVTSALGATVDRVTPALPAGCQSGDFLVAYAGGKNTGGGGVPQYNTPAGWASAGARQTDTQISGQPFVRTAAAGEVATEFVTTIVHTFLSVVVFCLRGDLFGRLRVVATAQLTDTGASGDPIVVPGIAAIAGDYFLLALGQFTRGGMTVSTPAGYTMPVDDEIGGVGGVEIAGAYVAYNGANPPATGYPVSNGANGCMYHMAMGLVPRGQFAGEPGGGVW